MERQPNAAEQGTGDAERWTVAFADLRNINVFEYRFAQAAKQRFKNAELRFYAERDRRGWKSAKYQGSGISIAMTCPWGHLSDKTPGNFVSGNRCRTCIGIIKSWDAFDRGAILRAVGKRRKPRRANPAPSATQ